MTFLSPLTAQDCAAIRGGALTIYGLGRLKMTGKDHATKKNHGSHCSVEGRTFRSSSHTVNVQQSHANDTCAVNVATITCKVGRR